MYVLDLKLFEEKIAEKEEFDQASYKAERDAEKSLLLDVICNRDKIEQCEDLSFDLLFDLIDRTDSIVEDYDDESMEKENAISRMNRITRIPVRRFI